MPDLNFHITGVESESDGFAPIINFELDITNTPATETIHSILLHAQIRIEPTQRQYDEAEKEKLSDLFGTPDRWGQTLRSRLWTHVNTTTGAFSGSTSARLPVICTYDMNVASTKYFHGLEGGEIPLLFLFSGTVFYSDGTRLLQAQPISWNKECKYRMPVADWQRMMDVHYPNSAWIYLDRDVFDRLYAYKRRLGIPTWEAVFDRLLPLAESTR
jgi:hypothetical protein